MKAECGELALTAFAGPVGAGETTPLTRLLRRDKAGEEDAFEALMVQHQAQVFRTALALLGDREDAKDATQEVFVRFFRHLDRVDEGREPAAWLYRITVNACRDLARRRNRARWLPWSWGRHAGAADPSEGQRLVLVREAREVVMAGLATLPARERAALVLRDLEGRSTKEVAQILGSSEVTVRSQVSRARLKLKRHRDRILEEQ